PPLNTLYGPHPSSAIRRCAFNGLDGYVYIAPLPLSMAAPISPPSNTFPARPALPASSISARTSSRVAQYPSFSNSSTNEARRGTSWVQGVSHSHPVDERTRAPGGSDSIPSG